MTNDPVTLYVVYNSNPAYPSPDVDTSLPVLQRVNEQGTIEGQLAIYDHDEEQDAREQVQRQRDDAEGDGGHISLAEVQVTDWSLPIDDSEAPASDSCTKPQDRQVPDANGDGDSKHFGETIDKGTRTVPDDAEGARVKFFPQVWSDNRALTGDPIAFEVPIEDVLDEDGHLLKDNSGATDRLKEHEAAPDRVALWQGPFYVVIDEVW
jgi:hypothetical protein